MRYTKRETERKRGLQLRTNVECVNVNSTGIYTSFLRVGFLLHFHEERRRKGREEEDRKKSVRIFKHVRIRFIFVSLR